MGQLQPEDRNANVICVFRKLLVSIKSKNFFFSTYDQLGVKLLQFNHLIEHKFKHGFCDTVNSTCACRAEVKTNDHFLLHCRLYSTQRLFYTPLKISEISLKTSLVF